MRHWQPPDKVEMVDMGTVTSIGGRMEPGTAMSVKVQAYNEDGDSPFLDENHYCNDQQPSAGGLQPDAQPLNFQAVFLDTPVAFVPTVEDATKQRRSLRSRDEEGTEFSDGRIGMTVHIAPGLVYREELELALCLQIDETCEPLLIYSNDKKAATDASAENESLAEGRYADTIVIADLPTDVEKSVYLEILMPPELSDKLRGRTESKYTIYASDVRSQNPTAKHIAVAEIPVVDLGGEDEATRSTRASTNWASCTTSAAASGILCKTRSLAKDFANSTFGVGFSLTPGLWLFSTKNDQNQTNRGVSIGADLNVTAKVFGFSIDNLAVVRGALVKSSGKKVTRKLTLDSLGANVHTKNEYRNKTSKSSAATWIKCKSDDPDCSYEPPSADKEGEGGDEEESADKDDKMLEFSREVKKGYEKIFVVYVVPVKVEAGVSGTVGVTAGATISLVTNTNYVPAGGRSNTNYVPSQVIDLSGRGGYYNSYASQDGVCLFSRESNNPGYNGFRKCIELPTGYGTVQIKKSTFLGEDTMGICGWPLNWDDGHYNTNNTISGLRDYGVEHYLQVHGLWKAELLLSGQKVNLANASSAEIQGNADRSIAGFRVDEKIAGAIGPSSTCSNFDTIRLTKMKSTSSETGLEFAASGGPYGSLSAYASGGVTIFIVEAGVRANLTLLYNGLALGVKAFLGKNPSFSGRVYNTLHGPSGNLELYATYYVPAFSLPPWEEKEATLNIISWSSFTKIFNIYEWSTGGSEQASQPSLSSGSASGQIIPEFTDTEPPPGDERWVCFYKGPKFDGDRKCTKMPEGQCGDYKQCKEIGFNLDVIGKGDWDKAVRSIKVFGPLRLAVFREKNFGKGDAAYYYASKGQVEQIGGNFYQGGSTFILDQRASSVRMTTIDTQTSYKPGSINATFYQKASREGKRFSESTSSELKVDHMKKNDGETASWWNDAVSSVYLSGVGTVCIYKDANFGGFESCYASRGSEFTVNQDYMNDETSSYALYSGTSYPLMLIENSSGTIEEAGTSSLPNGDIIASGPRAGYCTTSSCTRLSNDTANIAYVTGPATIFLYQHDNNVSDGFTQVFYLDEGEWDATYLINFTDTVSAMKIRNSKMSNDSWTEMQSQRDRLLRSESSYYSDVQFEQQRPNWIASFPLTDKDVLTPSQQGMTEATLLQLIPQLNTDSIVFIGFSDSFRELTQAPSPLQAYPWYSSDTILPITAGFTNLQVISAYQLDKNEDFRYSTAFDAGTFLKKVMASYLITNGIADRQAFLTVAKEIVLSQSETKTGLKTFFSADTTGTFTAQHYDIAGKPAALETIEVKLK
ncbi:MAG: hypothetical protein R3E08_02030 [Thiotrichaceae bacterium]